ncbi:SDR family NAD(P)-dependent oxidoreductase [Hydrogenophaga sp.]|uniref:SDR family NAD(P)-dependent oxidoreductase n=1 Tax=Hydrogenophaga sp. TaxID=1904254 RepID=UPI0027240A58|nr:SDR family NAD(P)-dependent oxidoreductase [Hydrogenophaga sp.]MDO9437601.1 SDR family oxidoreductase [Hydrogenophaga sp.]
MREAEQAGVLLQDKVIIVTGAGTGIGREIALQLASEGACIVVNDIGASLEGQQEQVAAADAVVAEIVARGGRAQANRSSVAEEAGAKNMVQQAMDVYGRLDAVVNNAGILRDGMFHKMTAEDFDAVVKVHLYGSFYLSRAAADPFRAQNGGSMVHMTSTAGLIGNIGQANYMAAKMGIAGLSRSIATDMERYGVRSNCVAPFADTRMTRSVPVAPGRAEAREARLKAMPASAVASLVGALISDDAKSVNGQIFGVRGGEVFVFNQPRPVRTIHHQGGWPMRKLGRMLPKFGSVFAPVSETGRNYMWEPVEE